MGVATSLALAVPACLGLHIAGTPLAAAGQLAGAESGVTTPTAGLLVPLPSPRTRLARLRLRPGAAGLSLQIAVKTTSKQ